MTSAEELGQLSPAEQRFETLRRRIGLVAGPLALLVLWLAPLPLEPAQHRLAAIVAFVIIYWLGEALPIPVTSLLALALCVLCGVESAGKVFGAFATPTIFLFIGSFILAEAMTRHHLDRRFAYLVLSLPGVTASASRIVVAFGAVTAMLSAFMSNTATTAMMMPIGLGIVGALASMAGTAKHPRFATALMLMTAYAASIGGLLTPVGSPPNLIGRAFIEQASGVRISFVQWTALAAPVVLVTFVALCFILLRLNRPELTRLVDAGSWIASERKKLGPLSSGERNTLVAFLTAVTLWMLPGIVAAIAGDSSPVAKLLASHIEEATVALLAAALLFFLPAGGRPTLTWKEAATIDWGTIILFGTGISLGSLLASSGLAEVMGHALGARLGGAAPWTVTLFSTLLAVVISETTSNTASVTIVVPIVLPITKAIGVDPILPALAAVFGASFGFMLPVSTPPNAIVYGSGLVPITKMLRAGAVFDVVGAAAIVVGLTLMVRWVL